MHETNREPAYAITYTCFLVIVYLYCAAFSETLSSGGLTFTDGFGRSKN